MVGNLGEEPEADLDGNSEVLVPLFGVFGTAGRCCGGSTVLEIKKNHLYTCNHDDKQNQAYYHSTGLALRFNKCGQL